MKEADWEALAYERIGRIMFAWGQLDHSVHAQTWHHNDPYAAFPTGPVERTFYRRWCHWCHFREADCQPKSRKALNDLRDGVIKLSEMRDDMAHNTISVTGYPDRHGVTVAHLPKVDWRARFDAWAAKWAQYKVRPAFPLGHTTYDVYGTRELSALLSSIETARDLVRAIEEAAKRGEKFALPSTPTVPEVLAHRPRGAR